MYKKIIKMIVAVCVLIALFTAVFNIAKINKTRYWVEAYCEQDGDELVFTFCGQSFEWKLSAGDKIPTGHYTVLLMENNGTEGFLEDDIIIKYK